MLAKSLEAICEFIDTFLFVYSGLFFSSKPDRVVCRHWSISVNESRLTCWFWNLSSTAEAWVADARDEGVRGCGFGRSEGAGLSLFGFAFPTSLCCDSCSLPGWDSSAPGCNMDCLDLGWKESVVRRSGSHSTIRSDIVSKRFCVNDFGSFKGCSAA